MIPDAPGQCSGIRASVTCVAGEIMRECKGRKRNTAASYILTAGFGCLAGILTRLTDFFPNDDLWSFSSIATLFGFWMVTVTLVILFSSSNWNAAVNVMLYLSSMNVSFYLLKYILGRFFPLFDSGGFQWNLLGLYTLMALLCSAAGFVLYYWSKKGGLGSFLYGLPVGGLAAETIAVGVYLFQHGTFLFQFIFDLAGLAAISCLFWRRAEDRRIYTVTAVLAAAAGYFIFYKPFL